MGQSVMSETHQILESLFLLSAHALHLFTVFWVPCFAGTLSMSAPARPRTQRGKDEQPWLGSSRADRQKVGRMSIPSVLG